MQDWGWMVSPHLMYGIWSSRFLHGNTYQSNQVRWDPSKFPTRQKIHGKFDDLDNANFISSNVNSSRKEALLYIFEDNEAVIKMIIKGRSPTMRHVSRKRRVALDWLFDRINLDPKSNTLTPRTNSQTYWQREISHVMNGIIFCVCLTLAISVLPVVLKWCRKERKRFRWRKCHSKIETGDEFGLAMQRKDSCSTESEVTSFYAGLRVGRRHSRSHRHFQFLSSIHNGFFELLVLSVIEKFLVNFMHYRALIFQLTIFCFSLSLAFLHNFVQSSGHKWSGVGVNRRLVSLSSDHIYPSGGFSSNRVNWVRPVQESDKSLDPSIFQ